MTGAENAGGHDRYCGATKRQGEGQCRKVAGWGTSHPGEGRCRLHGGSTRSQSKRVAEDAVQAQARVELVKLGVTPVEDPLTELQRLAGQVLAWERAVGQLLNEAGEIRYRSAHGVEQLRAEVALFERAMDRAGAVLTAMCRLNLDERLVKVSEQQAAIVCDALVAVLGEMGLSHEQQWDARKRFARHLRAVPDL